MKHFPFEPIFLLCLLVTLVGYGQHYAADMDGGEVMIPTVAKGLLSFWDYPRSPDATLAEYYNEKESTERLTPYVNWGPLHPYLVAISFKIFGISNFSARLPSLLFGFGILAFAYFFCKKILNESNGYLTALLLITSPLFLVYANNANYDVPMAFFLVASTYCLAYYLKTNKKKYLALSSIALGAGFWTKYTLTLAIVPDLIYIRQRKRALMFLGIFLIIASLLALYFTSRLGAEGVEKQFAKQAMRYFKNDGLFYRESTLGILWQFLKLTYPTLILGIVGFFALRKSKKKYERYAAYFAFLLFWLLLASSTKTLRHFAIILPFFAMLAGAGIRHLVRRGLYPIAVLLLLLHAHVLIINSGFVFTTDTGYSQLAPMFQKEFKLVGCDTRSIGYYANMEYYFSGKMRPGDFFNILSKDEKARYVVFCDYEGEFPRLGPKEIAEIKGYVTSRCKQMTDWRVTRGLSIFDCKEG